MHAGRRRRAGAKFAARVTHQVSGQIAARPVAPRASGISLAAPAPDLASRLRVLPRALCRTIERREAFVDMVRAVNATLDPAAIAEALIERASTWIPAPGWAVVSSDMSGELSVLSERGLDPALGPIVRTIATCVMERGEEVLTRDVRADPRLAGQSTATAVAFPLTCRGRQIGALVALDPLPSIQEPRVPSAMLHAITLLLEPAAASLDNALLLQRAEALSVTDDLTRLYNSRYLNQVLRRETKRATRTGRPLSVMFLDLDGFKAINDTYGHLSGSRALVEAASVIRASARETDVVARFGGDEFAIVLPDTGGTGALAVGERVRARIAEHAFLEADGVNFHLTASVGVATLPDVAAAPEALLQAADAAMYQVKDRGKNGIQSAAARADT